MNSEYRLENGHRPRISGALLQSGLWLRAGVIGAGAAILGLMMLAGGDIGLARGLLLAVSGALLAVYALRRSWLLLDTEGGEPAAERARPANVPVHALSFD